MTVLSRPSGIADLGRPQCGSSRPIADLAGLIFLIETTEKRIVRAERPFRRTMANNAPEGL